MTGKDSWRGYICKYERVEITLGWRSDRRNSLAIEGMMCNNLQVIEECRRICSAIFPCNL